MKFILPQLYFSKLLRAVTEFEMIQAGDKIMLGISGGKDSIFLAYAMALLKKRFKKDFSLQAVTVDPQFSTSFDTLAIGRIMEELEIPYSVVKSEIREAIEAQQGKDPCYTCAFFRRGAVNAQAKEMGCNKVAYAHHNDDAVETFLMSILYSGQIHTFTPTTYLSKTDLTVIRPLVYFREEEIVDAFQYHGFEAVESHCPYDGHTARQTIKELISTLSKDNPQLYPHLAAAMRKNNLGDLWPAPKGRKEMQEAYYSFIGKK